MDGAAPNARSSRMLALRYHSIGDLAGLGLEDIPVPVPAAGEVLVRIRAASLNPVDWKIATGSFRPLVRGGVPRTMGSDFAGEVTAIGSDVTTIAPGDRVFGFIDPFRRTGGTFAEFATVPVEFAHLLPDELGYGDAAALACVGATAVTLCNLGHVGAGSEVLVNGAIGRCRSRGGADCERAGRGRHGNGERGPSRVHSFTRCALRASTTGPSRCNDGLAASTSCSIACRTFHAAEQRSPAHAQGPLRHDGAQRGDVHARSDSPTDFGRVQRHGVMLKPNAVVMDEVLRYVAQGRLHCTIEHEFPLQQALRGNRTLTLGSGAGKARARHLPVKWGRSPDSPE